MAPDPPTPGPGVTGPLDAPGDPAPEPAEEPAAEPAVTLVDRLRAGAPLDVRVDDRWSEAGRKVLRIHLARMLARVPGVVAGEDAEEVHAMRVATRRMRAAWRVFGDGFERDAARRYRRELREIGGRLGAVRDLDVLIELVLVHGRQHGGRQRAGVEPLLASWHAERAARRIDLLASFASERFAAFTDDYVRLVETPELAALATVPHAPALVRNRMPATIWSAYQAVWAFEPDLASADLATLHQLRIAAKWLRYTLEFVREPMEPEAPALIRPVVALQDLLGIQHDRHVAGTLAQAFAASATLRDPQRRAIARLVADLDDAVEQGGRRLGATWRPLASPAYRRGLGRAIARL